MSNTSVGYSLLSICMLTFSLPANTVLADWSGKTTQNRYNSQFGDFPPEDIDQHIQNSLKKHESPTEPAPAQSTNLAKPNQSVSTPPQNYQQPYGKYKQQGNYNPQPGNYGNSRNAPRGNNTSFSGPWNNNGSNFNMPWGDNNGPNQSMPWGNSNGSNFSMPWGNSNGSNQSMPWGSNNGSNFSMPWGNNNRNYGNR